MDILQADAVGEDFDAQLQGIHARLEPVADLASEPPAGRRQDLRGLLVFAR